MARRTLIPLLAAAFALAACGGSSDVDKIKDIINGVAKDRASLCEHATAEFLKAVGGSRDACKELARGYGPPSKGSVVKGAIDVRVSGSKATADFTTVGGTRRHVSLVETGGEWYVDDVIEK
jgi:hypothetical protein